MRNRAARRLANIFRQHVDILDCRAIVSERFKNCFRITDRNPFTQEIAQNFLQVANRYNRWNRIVDNRLVCLTQIGKQIIDLLTVQQLIRMCLDDLRQMRNND